MPSTILFDLPHSIRQSQAMCGVWSPMGVPDAGRYGASSSPGLVGRSHRCRTPALLGRGVMDGKHGSQPVDYS